MTRETRVGLLLGLIFIIAFGFILSGLNGPTGAAPAAQNPATQPCEKSQYFTRAPVIESPIAQLRRVDQTQEDALASEGLAVRERSGDRTDTAQAHLTIDLPDEAAAPTVTHQEVVRQDVEPVDRSGPIGAEIIAHPNPIVQPRHNEPAGERVSGVREMDLNQLNSHFHGQVQANMRPQPQPQRQNQPKRVYVVRKGDTLTKIARQELKDGSGAAVRRIVEANRDRINNPNNLPIGLKIEIPVVNRGT